MLDNQRYLWNRVSKMRTHATTKEIWKEIFPEFMSSSGSIHVPMSKGFYKPEINPKAPEPALHSESDLTTLFLYKRWFDIGITFKNIMGGLPNKYPIEFAVHPELRVPIVYLAGKSCDLWWQFEQTDESKFKHVFPRSNKKRKRYQLGSDRVIQRYLEAYEYEVHCVVAPKMTSSEGKLQLRHTIVFWPFSSMYPTMYYHAIGRQADAFLDEPAEPIKPYDHFMGYYQFSMWFIHEVVVERLGKLPKTR